jgi:cytochrome c5
MKVGRRTAVVSILAIVGCASAGATNVRAPLAARLTPGARTGAPLPLRIDPNARVTHSTASNLPPATYWPAQAAVGEKVFGQTCALCHQRSQFIGQAFVESWNDRRVSDLYTLVRSTMPLTDPGGLKEDEYLGVIEYLLKENHAEPGPDSLRPDTASLRSHKIAARYP